MLSATIRLAASGLLFLTVVFISSCSEDEHTITQLLEDDLEGANGWVFVNVAPADQEGVLDNAISASSTHSLSITSSSEAGGFSFWRYTILQPDVPVGASLELTVKVKVSAITGAGAFVALRGDQSGSSVFFKTTQGFRVINGTNDFTTYKVNLESFPEGVDTMYIFLILDGASTGTVHFDDISLTSHH